MTDPYEEELFKFFTQPENFDTMLKVAAQAQGIKLQLVHRFWDLTKEKIATKLAEMPQDYQVAYSGDWNQRYNKLWVYHPEWHRGEPYPIMSVAFENIHVESHPYVGVHLHYDNKVFDMDALKQTIKEYVTLKSYKIDNNRYWSVWRLLNLNFSQPDSLKRLLPGQVDSTVEETSEEALQLLELVATHVTGWLDQHKK